MKIIKTQQELDRLYMVETLPVKMSIIILVL